MAKHGKPSKEKRQAERDRQKRLALEKKQQQHARLMRDMAFYADRDILESPPAWGEVSIESLWQSQNWRGEPEFAPLRFNAHDAGKAMETAFAELEFDPVQLSQLSEDERDDRTFELNAHAIHLYLTPAFKRDLLQRLVRFRERLRFHHESETLAQASLVQLMLQSEAEEVQKVWGQCMLVYQLHLEAVNEFVRLSDAAETAIKPALDLLSEDMTALAIAQAAEQGTAGVELEQAMKTVPGLRDFLYQSADRVVEQAGQAVFNGDLVLDLFTPEELAGFAERFAERFTGAIVKAGVDPGQPTRVKMKTMQRIGGDIFATITDGLKAIDTPPRRAALYTAAREHLQQMMQQSGQDALFAASLLTTLKEDEGSPLAENYLLTRALFGELRRYLGSIPADTAS